MQVNPQRIWTIFNHWVGRALRTDDPSAISQLGIDETSTRKRHNHVTVGVDMESERVIYVNEGKGKQAVQAIGEYLQAKGTQAEQIQQVSMDLSPAFIAGVKDAFPCAQITFDRFHIVKLLNQAMDAVRKAERKEHDALKGHQYTLLRNPESLSKTQQQQLTSMLRLYPTLGEAYRLKILFNDLWNMPDKLSAHAFLTQWCNEVKQAGIPAFQAFANTVISHWNGIIHFVESRLTNGILEGINNKIQLAKRRARGYRNINNFINMIYFLCGKLQFTYPRYFT